VKWSWKIGEYAGIGVFVHATFLLLIGWIAVSHLMSGQSVLATLAGVGFVLTIFGCVVLHEFGHALTARRFGIRTRDIVLLPIGGVARLERIPDDPRQELWVAIAGPAVNVVIALVLYVWLNLIGAWQPVTSLTTTSGSFLERLALVNVFIVLFNLIPAFPMDGGRVLRALLALKLNYARATRIAARVGQLVALVFGVVGLFTNPFLIFIAVFVWMGAAQEASLAQARGMLGGIPVHQVMVTDFRTLTPHDPLARGMELTLAGTQTDFPVVVGDRVVGVLTQADLIRGLEKRGRDAPVGELMHREFETADLSEMTDAVMIRLRQSTCHTVPVTRNGQLVGVVTMASVGEFIRIRSALGRG